MIIGVNGYACSGKDTIGYIIQYIFAIDKQGVSIEELCANYKDNEWWIEEQSGWQVRKFAGKLKDIAGHLLNVDVEKLEDQEFKKTDLGPEWGMTVRDFLQKLGTDAMRNGLHSDVWVNALMADYECTPADRAPNGWDCDDWIITDTRFPNEAKAIKDKGGIIIRVDRPGIKPVNPHPSEVALDDWNFDYKIVNISDIYSLKQTVEQVLKHAKIL
jgi:hypothetical protein